MRREDDLPKPKFTDRERAAYAWLWNRNVKGWTVDLVSKEANDERHKYKSIIELAQKHGWEG